MSKLFVGRGTNDMHTLTMKIWITGASGMVGRNLSEHPKLQEHELLTPTSAQLNLMDGAKVADWIDHHRPEMIVHCAGHVGGIQANVRAPVDFLVDNLEMGKNVVLNAIKHKVPKLINLGSSCIYPRGHDTPLTEEMILTGELEPTNEGYALAKIIVQRLCTYAQAQFGLNYKTLIPCNLYGRYDKFNPAHSHLVPAIVHKLHLAKKNGESSVEIWGEGDARREFMFAGDLADFIVIAIPRYQDVPPLLNVGPGVDHSINEYYQTVAEIVGFKGRFDHNLDKPVGMARKLLSVHKLSKFGWKTPTDLPSGIKATYDFYLGAPEWKK